jgi:hypothetical protein
VSRGEEKERRRRREEIGDSRALFYATPGEGEGGRVSFLLSSLLRHSGGGRGGLFSLSSSLVLLFSFSRPLVLLFSSSSPSLVLLFFSSRPLVLLYRAEWERGRSWGWRCAERPGVHCRPRSSPWVGARGLRAAWGGPRMGVACDREAALRERRPRRVTCVPGRRECSRRLGTPKTLGRSAGSGP